MTHGAINCKNIFTYKQRHFDCGKICSLILEHCEISCLVILISVGGFFQETHFLCP